MTHTEVISALYLLVPAAHATFILFMNRQVDAHDKKQHHAGHDNDPVWDGAHSLIDMGDSICVFYFVIVIPMAFFMALSSSATKTGSLAVIFIGLSVGIALGWATFRVLSEWHFNYFLNANTRADQKSRIAKRMRVSNITFAAFAIYALTGYFAWGYIEDERSTESCVQRQVDERALFKGTYRDILRRCELDSSS